MLLPLLGLLVALLGYIGMMDGTIVLLVDVSSSMNDEFSVSGSSSNKIEAAKKAATNLVDILPSQLSLVLMTYAAGYCEGAGVDWIVEQSIEGLGGTIVSSINDDPSIIKSEISKLIASGNTHLSEALWKAFLHLVSLNIKERIMVIVIGDGEDHCGLEPGDNVITRVADLGLRAGEHFTVQVVGLDVTDAERAKLEILANDGMGNYYSATEVEGIRRLFREFVQYFRTDLTALLITAALIILLFIAAQLLAR